MRLQRASGLIFLFTVALLAAVVAPTAADTGTPRFADVDAGAFHADAVEWAHELDVVTGFTPQCFQPDRTASRAEVAAVLQRLVAPDVDHGRPPHGFTDVHAPWQQEPVSWMAATGITTGLSATEFGPDHDATRAMIAAFLWRLDGSPAVGDSTHDFTDVTRAWQRDPVEWLWRNGLTTGRSPNMFMPDQPVTRGELLTFVWRWQGEPAPPADLVTPDPIDCLVATRTCAEVFSPDVVAEIEALAGGRRATAHVHDHRTGCTYELNPDLAVTTASVIKAPVLAGVLLQAQDRGTSGDLSPADEDRFRLMMHFSHNRPPTSALYVAVGGAAGMETIDARFDLTATQNTALYGATISSAADRTRLVEQLLVGGGPLDADSVDAAWEWMSGVSVGQSWGISAGLPAGHDFALKNGFYPMSGRGWRLGSTGVIRDDNGDTYAMTVMTEGNSTETAGIALVEHITAHVNDRLTLGDAASRPVDAVSCIETSGGTSWASAAATLGVGDAANLRHINGGEAAPLSGQRVCAPLDGAS